jgi:hypothetical protein
MGPCIGRAREAGVRRREVRSVRHLRAAQRCFGHVRRSAIDRLPVHKGVSRSRGDRTRLVRVSIVEIVVTVQDVDVRDSRVVDIHVAEVISAGVVPGMERLAET